MGGPGSGRRRWVTQGLTDEQRADRRRRQKRELYHSSPTTIERRQLELATRGEVTNYRDAHWGVEWVAVCRVCDKSRAEFPARVEAARWLVQHRATDHALAAGAAIATAPPATTAGGMAAPA